MDINVQSVHFKADQKLIDFCGKKINKLDSFFEGFIAAEIILKLDHDEDNENKVAEIKISAPANEYLFAKKQAKSFEEAVDMAIDALRKQIDRFKMKLKSK
jgi:putative sigma-54 modulation protein